MNHVLAAVVCFLNFPKVIHIDDAMGFRTKQASWQFTGTVRISSQPIPERAQRRGGGLLAPATP